MFSVYYLATRACASVEWVSGALHSASHRLLSRRRVSENSKNARTDAHTHAHALPGRFVCWRRLASAVLQPWVSTCRTSGECSRVECMAHSTCARACSNCTYHCSRAQATHDGASLHVALLHQGTSEGPSTCELAPPTCKHRPLYYLGWSKRRD